MATQTGTQSDPRVMALWIKAKLAEAIVSKTIVLGGSNPPSATNLLRGRVLVNSSVS